MTPTHASHLTPHTSQKGFTLVEALVSVLVLSMSLVAVTSLLTRALQATLIGQDYLIASKLAQEGMEMVRVKRNNNLIAQGANPAITIPWNENLIGRWEMESATANTSLARGGSFTVANPSAPGTFRIYTSGANVGKYTYTPNNSTTKAVPGNFKRVVTVTAITPHSASVTVVVTWNTNDSFTLSSIIYDAS